MIGYLFAILGGIIGLISITRERMRSFAVLEDWASENSFQITEGRRCFFDGPFFTKLTRGQTVYFVKIRDSSGNLRSGWVRCGIRRDNVEVKWDSQSNVPNQSPDPVPAPGTPPAGQESRHS